MFFELGACNLSADTVEWDTVMKMEE